MIHLFLHSRLLKQSIADQTHPCSQVGYKPVKTNDVSQKPVNPSVKSRAIEHSVKLMHGFPAEIITAIKRLFRNKIMTHVACSSQ